MRKIVGLSIATILLLSMLVGCGQTNSKPPVLEQDEIKTMTNDVAVEDSETQISSKQVEISSPEEESESVKLVDEKLYRDSFYGVPVRLNGQYYKVPAVKILNYYFLDIDAVKELTGIDIKITDDGMNIDVPSFIEINTSNVELGSVDAKVIDVNDVKLISDDEKLAINYRNKNYISIITLKDYMPSEKFYIDRSLGAVTNEKPIINHPNINENGLLRKNIKIDDERELLVREGSQGKMLVIYDIYGTSLNITPDDLSFATDLQNIFLHKTDNGIYMFGLMGNSTEVYKIDIDKDMNINISAMGSVQKASQNIYYLGNKYIAIGRGGVFGISIKDATDTSEAEVYELNMKTAINFKECGGDFIIVGNDYYLPVKSPMGEIVIYKLNIGNFQLEKVKVLDLTIEIDDTRENFYYSFLENGLISIYLMDNTGYIYNVTYNLETDETKITQTDKFKLFYNEYPYSVEFVINLVKANETGDSELSLTVNGKYLGNNILIYGIEDNWVYCSEYVTDGDSYSLYSFRYNAITGVKDYANLA